MVTKLLHPRQKEDARGRHQDAGWLPQQEIVRRVEALFALADRIEARAAKAKAHLARLTPFLLAKAFRGDLVPTEADLARQEGRDYEPASTLLERIKTERTSPTAKPKPRRGRSGG